MPLALAVCKGRANSKHLLPSLRHICALSLATGCRLHCRWLPSQLNVADLPSRGFGRWDGETLPSADYHGEAIHVPGLGSSGPVWCSSSSAQASSSQGKKFKGAGEEKRPPVPAPRPNSFGAGSRESSHAEHLHHHDQQLSFLGSGREPGLGEHRPTGQDSLLNSSVVKVACLLRYVSVNMRCSP
jgi:hypothetical protein